MYILTNGNEISNQSFVHKKKNYVLFANSEVIKDVPTVNYNYIIVLQIIDLTIKN